MKQASEHTTKYTIEHTSENTMVGSVDQASFDTAPRERVYSMLDRLEISYTVVEHPAMFSEADTKLHEHGVNAVIFKNLFLRNKNKSRYYLYTLPITKHADLAALAAFIDETRFSFGNENELWEKLHIHAGSVSPLNVLDAQGTDLEILIDKDIFDCEQFGIHPNENTATVLLSPHDLMRILDAVNCRHRIVKTD